MSPETLEQYKARVARAGGHARAAKLTKKQRSDSAKKAADARWAKTMKKLDNLTERLDTKIAELKKANRASRRKKKAQA